MADHRPTTTPATASSDASDLDNETDDAPLYDGPSFEELGVPAALAQVLADAGIHNPFPIQAATLPDSLAGRDVLGRGRTGSGKTLAFALPLVTRLAADGGAPVIRERDLENHLALEGPQGGAPPEPRSRDAGAPGTPAPTSESLTVADVPADPTTSKDLVLRTGYQLLRSKIEGR